MLLSAKEIGREMQRKACVKGSREKVAILKTRSSQDSTPQAQSGDYSLRIQKTNLCSVCYLYKTALTITQIISQFRVGEK